MSYLMESHREGERLKKQEAANPSELRLRAAGLQEGMRALDAGCGAGAVTEVMGRMVGSAGSVVGMDRSGERLEEARRTRAQRNVEYLRGDVCDTRLPAGTFDFVWSQYVLEYLPQPSLAIDEALRLLAPGGRLAIVEIDGSGLANHPFPAELEAGYRALMNAVAQTGFDLFVGRKLFHLFKNAGLVDVTVRLEPMYVVAGRADDRLIEDWRQRLATLAPLGERALGGREAYERFSAEYLALLGRDDVLNYSVQLITEGRKP